MMKIPLYSKKYPGMFALIDNEDYKYIISIRWNPSKNGNTFYAASKNGILMHRTILNPPPGMEPDHIDHNGLNNQRANLRICTHSQNLANQLIKKFGTSKFRGVSWNKQRKKWVAQITKEQKDYHIGCFNDEIVAAKEYNKKAIDLFGEFALLNILGE